MGKLIIDGNAVYEIDENCMAEETKAQGTDEQTSMGGYRRRPIPFTKKGRRSRHAEKIPRPGGERENRRKIKTV